MRTLPKLTKVERELLHEQVAIALISNTPRESICTELNIADKTLSSVIRNQKFKNTLEALRRPPKVLAQKSALEVQQRMTDDAESHYNDLVRLAELNLPWSDVPPSLQDKFRKDPKLSKEILAGFLNMVVGKKVVHDVNVEHTINEETQNRLVTLLEERKQLRDSEAIDVTVLDITPQEATVKAKEFKPGGVRDDVNPKSDARDMEGGGGDHGADSR